MKLRNKQTGEIIDLEKGHICETVDGESLRLRPFIEDGMSYTYSSLAEFNEHWEDYEEPKVYYYISDFGAIREREIGKFPEDEEDRKRICNYFETKEEAEKALEKLKAWKRVKDSGFKFKKYKRDEIYYGDIEINAIDEVSCDDKDMDLLFRGEE